MDKISIIIVNWNTGSLLGKCIQSLVNLPEDEREIIDEVIVVDNASTDRSIPQAKVITGRAINHPRVRYVMGEENLGFAGGNNLGFKRIRDRHSENLPHVWLLNPDTEVKTGVIKGMMEALDRRAKTGVLGVKLINPDGSVQKSMRNFPTFRQFVWLMLKLGKLVDYGQFDYEQEQKVDQVMGASFLIRNELWQKIGELDDDFWIWFEEVDYCMRAYEAGWEVWYTPRVEVIHHGGVSFGQLIGYRRSMPWLRSMAVYATKYFTSTQARVILWMRPISLLLMFPVSIKHFLLKRRNEARL